MSCNRRGSASTGAWLHQVAGLPSVGDAPLVQVTLAGLRSKLVWPKMCKEPVTADMLVQLYCSGKVKTNKYISRLLFNPLAMSVLIAFVRC